MVPHLRSQNKQQRLNVFQRKLEENAQHARTSGMNPYIGHGLSGYIKTDPIAVPHSTPLNSEFIEKGANGRTPSAYGLLAMRNVLKAPPSGIGLSSMYPDHDDVAVYDGGFTDVDSSIHVQPPSPSQDALQGSQMKVSFANSLSAKPVKRNRFKVRRRNTGGSRMNKLRGMASSDLAQILMQMKNDGNNPIGDPDQQIGSPDVGSMMSSLGRGDLSINLDLDALTNMLASARRQKYVGQMTETRNRLRNIG